jgi:hypothetical protein
VVKLRRALIRSQVGSPGVAVVGGIRERYRLVIRRAGGALVTNGVPAFRGGGR